MKFLANLNEFKSPGPHELHSMVWKKLVEVIAEPLSALIEKSQGTGQIESYCCSYFQKREKATPRKLQVYVLGIDIGQYP